MIKEKKMEAEMEKELEREFDDKRKKMKVEMEKELEQEIDDKRKKMEVEMKEEQEEEKKTSKQQLMEELERQVKDLVERREKEEMNLENVMFDIQQLENEMEDEEKALAEKRKRIEEDRQRASTLLQKAESLVSTYMYRDELLLMVWGIENAVKKMTERILEFQNELQTVREAETVSDRPTTTGSSDPDFSQQGFSQQSPPRPRPQGSATHPPSPPSPDFAMDL